MTKLLNRSFIMKRVIGIIVAIAIIAVLLSLRLTHRNSASAMVVQATVVLVWFLHFSIINEISQEVGGKYVNAHTITAIGADQHDYDPTPIDVGVQDAARCLCKRFEPWKGGPGWFDKLMKTTDKHYGKQIFNVTDGIDTIKLTTAGAGQDNHAWNGILKVRLTFANIAKVLEKKDPKHKAYYAKRGKGMQIMKLL